MYFFFANDIATAEEDALIAACNWADKPESEKDWRMIYAASASAAWAKAERLKEYNKACSHINFFRRKIKESLAEMASLI